MPFNKLLDFLLYFWAVQMRAVYGYKETPLDKALFILQTCVVKKVSNP